MKKNFKMFVLGLLTGVVLVSAPVMANDLWEKIDVVRNKIAVMVNGQKLDADNFLYNDTTYVPIRAVAESLGVNVEYKDGVAYIGTSFGAVFGGDEIKLTNTLSATTEEMDDYLRCYRNFDETKGFTEAQLKEFVTGYLARDKALFKLAKDNGVVIDAEFEQYFEDSLAYMDANYGGREGTIKALEEIGYTYNMYKRYRETEYLYEKLLSLPALAPGEAEIKSFYDTNKEIFAYDGVQAKHILISTKDKNGNDITDEAELKKIKDKANAVHKTALSGADFDELIKKWGEDPGMASNPDGYVFTYGEMVEEFEKTAFALKDGAISAPVKTQYGWHIIKKIKTIDSVPLDEKVKKEISRVLTSETINTKIGEILSK